MYGAYDETKSQADEVDKQYRLPIMSTRVPSRQRPCGRLFGALSTPRRSINATRVVR